MIWPIVYELSQQMGGGALWLLLGQKGGDVSKNTQTFFSLIPQRCYSFGERVKDGGGLTEQFLAFVRWIIDHERFVYKKVRNIK